MQKVPCDYSAALYMDISIICGDGVTLRFSRYLLSQHTYFAAALNFNGQGQDAIEVEFAGETMNIILNHIDTVNGRVILPEDIGELAIAAHYFMLGDLQRECKEEMLLRPRREYILLTYSLYPEIRIALMLALSGRGLLSGVSMEGYKELFKFGNTLDIAKSFVADGHRYSPDIFADKDINTDLCSALAKIFDCKEATERLLQIVAARFKKTIYYSTRVYFTITYSTRKSDVVLSAENAVLRQYPNCTESEKVRRVFDFIKTNCYSTYTALKKECHECRCLLGYKKD